MDRGPPGRRWGQADVGFCPRSEKSASEQVVMPTNLPPEYFEADKRYRAASSPSEKITCLEDLLGTIPKHKGTDKLRADLRRRLSKLKSAAQTKKGAGKRETAYHFDKEGAGQVVVIGPANVGKSALVVALTNASPEVADFPFTTWNPTPGMMEVGGIQIQLIDTPPLSRDFIEPDLMDLIRRSDLMLLVVDLLTDPVQQLEDTVAMLGEHRIVPCYLRERCVERQGVTFKPILVLANKCDDAGADENYEIFCELLGEDWPMLAVSATSGRNLERMKQVVVQRLEIIRVYSKIPGQEPDLSRPFVLKQGDTVQELAGKVHQDFVRDLKLARVWGEGVFDGQLVGRDHVLSDGDVVELHI
jgi:ribosome-interacting GTPase 1